MHAFLFFAERRRRRELAERLNLDALAARGDPKKVASTAKGLAKERPPGSEDR